MLNMLKRAQRCGPRAVQQYWNLRGLPRAMMPGAKVGRNGDWR
jgi:hypothetical protein